MVPILACRRLNDRIAGAEEFGGGLGLAIVKWIADLHHTDFSLSDTDPSGLCCTVTFEGSYEGATSISHVGGSP